MAHDDNRDKGLLEEIEDTPLEEEERKKGQKGGMSGMDEDLYEDEDEVLEEDTDLFDEE